MTQLSGGLLLDQPLRFEKTGLLREAAAGRLLTRLPAGGSLWWR